jgi:hypothetical protein
MSDEGSKLDGVIDAALRALTSGVPSDGLRGRVMARVADGAEPASGNSFGVFGWRAHPLRWATVVALAVVALTSTLLVSRLVQSGPKRPDGTAPVAALVAPAPSQTGSAAQHVPILTPAAVVDATPRALPIPAQIARKTVLPTPAATNDDAPSDAVVGIVPLAEPNPIADRPIEITPLAIRPVSNREIQIRLIETDRYQKGPGQTDND